MTLHARRPGAGRGPSFQLQDWLPAFAGATSQRRDCREGGSQAAVGSVAHPLLKRAGAIGLAALIAACGGSGGGSASGDASPTEPSSRCAGTAALEVVADATVPVGRVAGAVALGCRGVLAQVRWTQVAGEPVGLLAGRTQAISFEAERPGSYRFRVDATDDWGNPLSGEASIEVVTAAAAGGSVTVRLDHALRSGQRGSLRAWPTLAAGDAIGSLTWTQVEGPAALDIDASVPQRLLFTAPSVERDALLRFRATLTTRDGAVDSDEVSVVVEALPPLSAGRLFTDRVVQRVHAYRATSPFADRLVDCVYSPALYFNRGGTNLCPLSRLPLLAAGAADAPSVEAIMDRVVVSHDWMGEVFERFLRTQDEHGDFRRLLGAVTAIVLGSHVRPSFYWSATGAIYIDAENLWLTAGQRDVIGEVPDFRLAYDDELNFGGPWRYTIGDAEAQLDFPPDRRALPRDVGYLAYELGPLLYHELAHANDFLPAAVRATVDPTRLVYQAAPAILPSDRLAWTQPLFSAEMFALARVKFFGAVPTAEQKAYSPADVAGFFGADVATDEYSYARPDGVANSREDLAMLFEEFMMSHRHGVRRDVAFTGKLQDGQTAADLVVAWGSRGRIGEGKIRPRVRQVLGEIAPWLDAAAVDALPAPLAMRPGESWLANLNLLPDGTAVRAEAGGEAARARGRLAQQLRRPYVVAPPLPR